MDFSNPFKDIPQSRALLYIVIAGLIPLFFVVIFLMSQLDELQKLKMQIRYIELTALQKQRKQAVNIALRNNYHEAEHFYIDKNLESLRFLEPEVESLKKIMSNSNFAEDENIRKRLTFLTGPENRLAFTEGVMVSTPFFQETTETLVHPVEVDILDVKKILALVEGVDIGAFKPAPARPQLLVLDFKLEKKSVEDKSDVFTLNMKLLKREFP